LAEAVQLSTSAIAMYETANRDPDTATLQKLADFFDVSLDYLLGRSDTKGMYRNGNDDDLIKEDSPEYSSNLNNQYKIKLMNDIISDMKEEGILGEDFVHNEETDALILRRFNKLVRMYKIAWEDEASM